jgi:hypothetical protein
MPFESYSGHGIVILQAYVAFAFAVRPFRRRRKTLQVQTPHIAEPPVPSSNNFFTFSSKP